MIIVESHRLSMLSDYKAIGFDMDGTLLHTFIDYEKLGNVLPDTLLGLGVPPSELNTHSPDRDIIGHSISYLAEKGVAYTFGDIEEFVRERTVAVEIENVGKAEPFPGTEGMLLKLKSDGFRIGVLSRGHRAYVEKALSSFGLMDLFDAIDAYDDHPPDEAKPNPVAMKHLADKLGVSPKDILYLGDSRTDYECARDSGSGFIAVSSGRLDEKRWRSVSSDIRIIGNVSELLKLL